MFDTSFTVSISRAGSNSKLGAGVASVSMPAVVTCAPGVPCAKLCYARKLEAYRKSVRDAYARNLQIYTENPRAFWIQVESAIACSRFFRFHVSGDIVNADYFKELCDVCARQCHCKVMLFTKKYSIVNDYIAAGGVIPQNVSIIFSHWIGYKMENPYNLPVAYVRFKDGTTCAPGDAVACTGDCTQCALCGRGCWTLKNGQSVVFDEH